MSVESPDYENALWSQNFYSSPAVLTQSSSSNHLQSLKQSVNIPASGSLQSLSGHVATAPADHGENDGNGPSPTKTSLMRISPSLKALESILNSEQAPVCVADTIPEEEESLMSPRLEAPPAVAAPAPADTRSNDSVSSRRSSAARTAPSVSSSRTATSTSTIKEPHLPGQTAHSPAARPAAFDHSDASTADSPTLSVADEPKSPEKPQEPTEIPSAPEATMGAPDIMNSSSNTAPRVAVPKRSMLDVGPFSASPKKEPPMKPIPKKEPVETLPKNAPVESLPKEDAPSQPSVANSRSNSTSTVKTEPDNKTPAPMEPKRSSTMQNLSASKITPIDKQSSSKRFSFRAMFKTKSKNHSLSKMREADEELPPSQPVKLSAKSFSTSNISSLYRKNEPVEPKPKGPPKRNIFARKKSEEFEIPKGPPPKPIDTDPVQPAPVIAKSAPVIVKQVEQETKPVFENTPAPVQAEMSPMPSLYPKTPMGTSSVFSTETPPTGALDPSKTIREVDDSDYSPNITREEPNAEYRLSFGPPESPLGLGVPSLYLNGSLDPQAGAVFGSPFAVQYPGSTKDSVPSTPHFSPSSPSRKSAMSPSGRDQLVGEALFPKSLNSQEIEDIVSLERSMSMRSLRSSKRNSFRNYKGSDENIILGGDPSIIRQGSMKRSGSILKNSSSSRSLRGEILQRIEHAPEPQVAVPQKDITDVSQDETAYSHIDTHSFASNESKNLRYSDFIEFSDYIDIDNLDFSSSPRQSHADSPALTHTDTERSLGYPNPESFVLENREEEDSEHETSLRPASHVFAEPPIVVVSTQSSEDKVPAHVERAPAMPATSPLALQTGFEPSTPELDSATSPLDRTFDFTIESVQQRASPGTAQRPFSMSFKGFSGSTFKDKVMTHSGSHQSIQFEEDSLDESSAVGQGFGTSDEDDSEEDEDFRMSILEHNRQKRLLAESGGGVQPRGMNHSELRRQQHLKNVLSLQPPASAVPFHHNRIPSLSDQSNASSPRSLTSFITRMRKSPLSSPRVSAPRRTVQFSSRIVLYDTYHHDEYDRHPEVATCNQLTPQLAQQIKEELNEVKASMEVHEDSICYTQFF